MKDSMDCDDHHMAFAPKMHPDGKHSNSKMMMEHQRGAAHPAKHSKGKMPSQLQPDHGPHK